MQVQIPSHSLSLTCLLGSPLLVDLVNMNCRRVVSFAAMVLASSWVSNAYQNTSSILNIDPLQQPYPYYFPPQDAKNTAALFPMPSCFGVTLEEATIDQLADYMGNGMLTSSQLLRCYLRRVQQVDEYVNSVIELNPDAEDIAAALDAERAAGHVRGRCTAYHSSSKITLQRKTRWRLQQEAGCYWEALCQEMPTWSQSCDRRVHF